MSWDDTQHFAADYQQARQTLLAACAVAGAELDSLRHPQPGPDGRALFTDVALLGPPDAGAALLLQSATHGGEGFAGSAIQTALLHDPELSRPASHLRLIVIHGINPWGFAHLRRTDENNVDLNRNFVDHSQAYPANPPYTRLAELLAPRELSALTPANTLARLLGYAAVHGMGTLRAAVSAGQYSHPQGLFFGGHFAVWSHRVFQQILENHVAGRRHVAFLDFHTGLGPPGYGELILNDPKGSPAYKRALAWWGERVKTTKTDESVSADLMGTLKVAIDGILRDAQVTAGSLEFGTRPQQAVLWALITENWLHHHGGPDHPRHAQIKANFRRAFCIETAQWQSAVLGQGRQVILEAIKGLG